MHLRSDIVSRLRGIVLGGAAVVGISAGVPALLYITYLRSKVGRLESELDIKKPDSHEAAALMESSAKGLSQPALIFAHPFLN